MRMVRILCVSVCLTSIWLDVGCNVDRVARLVEKTGTRTLGRNEAVGGVDYVQKGAEQNRTWDRHITSCRVDESGALSFDANRSKNILQIVSSGENPYAIVYTTGPVRFDRKQCSTFKVTMPASGNEGSATLICAKEDATLNTTVRFGGCTR
jgi:hypothetical protein